MGAASTLAGSAQKWCVWTLKSQLHGSGPFLSMTQLPTQPPPPTACILQREAERACGPQPRALPAAPLTQTRVGLPLCSACPGPRGPFPADVLRGRARGLRGWTQAFCQPPTSVLCNSVPPGSPGLVCMDLSMTHLFPPPPVPTGFGWWEARARYARMGGERDWNIPRASLCLRTAIRAGALPSPWPGSGAGFPQAGQ